MKGNGKTVYKELNEEDERKKYTFANNTYDDSIYGYRIYTEIATGSLKDTNVKNIYDMAGNMWEWTTEVGDHSSNTDSKNTVGNYAVLRGGSFGHYGYGHPVSHRDGYYTVDWPGYIHVGFRVVLYIQN